MPYAPFAITQRDRNRAFWKMWVSAAATPLTIAGYLFDLRGLPFALLTGLSMGGVVGSCFSWRMDSYYRSLCAMGHRWMAGFIVLYTFAIFIIDTSDRTFSFGRVIGRDGESMRRVSGLLGSMHEGGLVLLLAALAFYCGYTFAWLRDRRGKVS